MAKKKLDCKIEIGIPIQGTQIWRIKKWNTKSKEKAFNFRIEDFLPTCNVSL